MKILLPVDGSAAALAAVAHALALVRAGLEAEFVLANVQEPASLYEMVVAHDAEVIEKVRSDAGADLLRPAEALLEAAGLPYESEVAGGQPAGVLVELLENYGCEAVIMGAAGIGSGAGSVALAMLQRSPVPVTLVRAPEPSEADDALPDLPPAGDETQP